MGNIDFYIMTGFVTILAIVSEIILIPQIIYVAYKKNLFDLPDPRKKHDSPIPRLGGVTFMPIIFFYTLLSFYVRYKMEICTEDSFQDRVPEVFTMMCGLFLIYCVGLKDDLTGVGFKVKFAVQFVASLFVIGSGVYIDNFHGLFGIEEIPYYIGIPVTILFIVFTSNALNLIDGADGLASGLSLISFVAFGLLFIESQKWTYAIMAFCSAGVLIAFFYYNFFHPKGQKIFMGDTGSLTLGYLLSFMMIALMKTPPPVEGIPSCSYLIVIISAVFIPLYDAIRVMVVRILSLRSPFSPDRNHIHHKLIDLGLSRRKAVVVILFMGIFLYLLNYVLAFLVDCTPLFIINIAISILIAVTLILLTRNKIKKTK